MNSFTLLFIVIMIQLLTAVAVVTSCTIRNDSKCQDGKISEFFTFIAAQTFALYAAEKASGGPPTPPRPPHGRL